MAEIITHKALPHVDLEEDLEACFEDSDLDTSLSCENDTDENLDDYQIDNTRKEGIARITKAVPAPVRRMWQHVEKTETVLLPFQPLPLMPAFQFSRLLYKSYEAYVKANEQTVSVEEPLVEEPSLIDKATDVVSGFIEEIIPEEISVEGLQEAAERGADYIYDQITSDEGAEDISTLDDDFDCGYDFDFCEGDAYSFDDDLMCYDDVDDFDIYNDDDVAWYEETPQMGVVAEAQNEKTEKKVQHQTSGQTSQDLTTLYHAEKTFTEPLNVRWEAPPKAVLPDLSGVKAETEEVVDQTVTQAPAVPIVSFSMIQQTPTAKTQDSNKTEQPAPDKNILAAVNAEPPVSAAVQPTKKIIYAEKTPGTDAVSEMVLTINAQPETMSAYLFQSPVVLAHCFEKAVSNRLCGFSENNLLNHHSAQVLTDQQQENLAERVFLPVSQKEITNISLSNKVDETTSKVSDNRSQKYDAEKSDRNYYYLSGQSKRDLLKQTVRQRDSNAEMFLGQVFVHAGMLMCFTLHNTLGKTQTDQGLLDAAQDKTVHAVMRNTHMSGGGSHEDQSQKQKYKRAGKKRKSTLSALMPEAPENPSHLNTSTYQKVNRDVIV